ncbi:MAG: formylglycine-generating enzyme family protein [Verrucomicrobiales bacterium]|nr:formylglycine-generating enzyme family protein [Verrucomicrobiales bacterium]
MPPPWAEIFGEDDSGIFAEFTLKQVRFAWRWIPSGRFLMGSPNTEPGRWPAEGPQHEVLLSGGFWMGETSVTQGQWRALMQENPSGFPGDQRPVENVTWHDAVTYSDALNDVVPALFAVLPTEAQWEYACRAGTDSAFSDGSPCTQPEGDEPALEDLGWYDVNSRGETHPVRQKRPNSWGLYDLHGNVWEWCRDGWYNYGTQSKMDPVYEPKNESANRVIRGGSWIDQARDCRSAYRNLREPGYRYINLGFRLAAGLVFRVAELPDVERPMVPEKRSRD